MTPFAADELVIIRHAPSDHGGRLCGRTDVPAFLPPDEALAPLRTLVSGANVICSPALRCKQTSAALFDHVPQEDARLWEQDFGAHDGRRFEELPDIGTLPLSDLACYAAPGGESFVDMFKRVRPALEDSRKRAQAGGPYVLVAHAGTARAGLGLALGDAALGLKFEIAPLSLTRLRCLEDGFSIVAVNERVV